MFRWFETRINAFPEEMPERPPDKLWAFYWHFLRPVWPAFLLLLIVGLVGSLIEVALYAFIGTIVDRMKAAQSPQSFISDNGSMLVFMAFVALILRPLVSTAHDLTKNQMIALELRIGR